MTGSIPSREIASTWLVHLQSADCGRLEDLTAKRRHGRGCGRCWGMTGRIGSHPGGLAPRNALTQPPPEAGPPTGDLITSDGQQSHQNREHAASGFLTLHDTKPTAIRSTQAIGRTSLLSPAGGSRPAALHPKRSSAMYFIRYQQGLPGRRPRTKLSQPDERKLRGKPHAIFRAQEAGQFLLPPEAFGELRAAQSLRTGWPWSIRRLSLAVAAASCAAHRAPQTGRPRSAPGAAIRQQAPGNNRTPSALRYNRFCRAGHRADGRDRRSPAAPRSAAPEPLWRR